MNAESLARHLSAWIREQAEAAAARGVVLGLSGGIDSAVVAGLVREAFPETHLALIIPIHSEPQDLEDARLVVSHFKLNSKELRLDSVYERFATTLGAAADDAGKPDLALANLKARLRMVALYYHANKFRHLVAGTGNRSELTLGYFTKYGDGGVDLLPLGHLVKREVRELAAYLEVPQSVLDKPPAAGLWAGLTDEKELGFSYGQLEDYLLGGCAEPGVQDKVDSLRRANAHKLRTPKLPPPASAG